LNFSRVSIALLLLISAGVGAFLFAIFGADPGRAWQALLVNLLFFSAIAQSGPVLAAIYHLTEAKWGGRVMRLALGLGSFLPISFILFGVLLLASPLLPEPSAAFPSRAAWFNRPFLIGRDALALAVLYSVSLGFVYQFLNTDRYSENSRSMATGDHVNLLGNRGKLTSLAIAVIALYALVFSLIGFDLVMALDHSWSSTLFGAYFFLSSFYVGLSAITGVVIIAGRFLDPKHHVENSAFGDLGKLLFAFCFLTVYFLWSQYLVTWYGNLPEEVGFFLRRIQDPAWAWLSWTTLASAFGIPFLALLGQHAKRNTTILCVIVVIALIGMWFERYLLVAPSIGLDPEPRIGWTETITTLTFIAAMALTYTVYLNLILPRWSAAKLSTR
jgi:hypothetical protein